MNHLKTLYKKKNQKTVYRINKINSIETIENGVKVYRKYYPEKEEQEYKIIALRLKKLVS